MAIVPLIEYPDASPAVRAVYDDIRATRKTDIVNNFWKTLANDPALLASTWAATKSTLAAGALDAVTKELIYLAVSITNDCEYCIHTHAASGRAKGMSTAMFNEMVAVTALANGNNRLASAYRMDVDAHLGDPLK